MAPAPLQPSQPAAAVRRAVELRLAGCTLQQIRADTGLSAPTVIGAYKRFLSQGWAGIAPAPRGRRPGQGRTLTADDDVALQQAATADLPEAHGLSDALWTGDALARLAHAGPRGAAAGCTCRRWPSRHCTALRWPPGAPPTCRRWRGRPAAPVPTCCGWARSLSPRRPAGAGCWWRKRCAAAWPGCRWHPMQRTASRPTPGCSAGWPPSGPARSTYFCMACRSAIRRWRNGCRSTRHSA